MIRDVVKQIEELLPGLEMPAEEGLGAVGGSGRSARIRGERSHDPRGSAPRVVGILAIQPRSK
jgi:hypothetical protein